MKKLFFSGLLLLISVSIFSQSVSLLSHTFENIEEKSVVEGEWGSWVASKCDISISQKIVDNYILAIKENGESNPELYFVLKFLEKRNDWYVYVEIDLNDICKVRAVFTSVTLDEMLVGVQGDILLFLPNDKTVGYKCKD